MIKVCSLHKIYNENKKNSCHALKGVSFNLDKTGMIFILGKSGSGKSTLLNLLGGLDSPTKGSIIFDKEDLSSFSTKELENYRNNNVGFVFQDYCLIEGMTVYENVELALSLQNKNEPELVEKILKEVDLLDKKNSPVNTLSGGQKQRVAIARAIIKSPPLILADEPTGNLDSRTSRQIFSILKALSKDRLIIIVSHNVHDANEYADRIIEISDGQIVEDVDNFPSQNENVAVLTKDAIVSDETLTIINESIKAHRIEVVRQKHNRKPHLDKFECENEMTKYSQKNKMLTKARISLFKHFFKQKGFGTFIMVIALAFLITLTGLCQTLYSINNSSLLAQAVEKDDYPLIFQKGVYDEYAEEINSAYLGAVTEEDVNAFKQNGYDGEAFKLLRYSIPIISNTDNICFGKQDGFSIANGLFITNNGNGVLQCTKEYLANLYGENGELTVLSGSLEAHDGGIIVTDYFADCLLSKNPHYISSSLDKYEKLTSSPSPLSRRFKINAVISTNYTQRYSELIEKFELASQYPAQANEYIAQIHSSELALKFTNEVNHFLAIAYTFNPNFLQSTLQNPKDTCYIHYFENVEITSVDGEIYLKNNPFYQCVDDVELTDHLSYDIDDDEIILTLNTYNDFFGTNLSSTSDPAFEEKQIVLNLYTGARKYGDAPKTTKTLTVKGLSPSRAEYSCIVSDNTFRQLREIDMSAYALYFNGGSNDVSLYESAEDLHFKSVSPNVIPVQIIIKTLNVFKDVFTIILIGLILISTFVLSSFVTKIILSFKREIGIMRALGAKTTDVASPFNLIAIIIGLSSALLSSIGFDYICSLANDMLSKGFALNFSMDLLSQIVYVSFNPLILLVDLLIMFGIITTCLLTPLLVMRKIKPIDIMRKD